MKQAYDFPITDAYSKEDVKRVQDRLLEMAKCVAEVLEKNNVKYMLAFGSLLGAVREGGFIPWDDDLDFMILEDDYDKALECLEGNLPDSIIIQNIKTDPNYAASWTKLRDRDTDTYAELFKTDNHFTYRGLCLDLYRCESVKEKDVSRVVFKENIAYFKRKRRIPDVMTDEELEEKLAELEPLYQKAVVESETSDKNDDVFAFTSIYNQKFYKHDWVLPLKKYKFEDAEFYGPKEADTILSLTYRDYMKVPPYEKRHPHYSWVKFFKK